MHTGLTILFRKNTPATETAREEIDATEFDGLLESSEDTRMNDSGGSREEAIDRKMEVLSAKTKTRIGSWNVRTMYETEKLAQVTAEMRHYCGRGAQDPTAHVGNHSEAGPEQTGVAILCCYPVCLTLFTNKSE